MAIRTFQQKTAVTSGPLTGDYLWSNAANWTTNVVPVNLDSVVTGNTVGYDDLAALTLASLAMTAAARVDVTGASFNAVSVGGNGTLLADALTLGAPVTINVGSITGTGGLYEAVGAGALFFDHSATDTGNIYEASTGGFFELTAAPSSNSVLEYAGAYATFALQNPAATNTVMLEQFGQDEVLELPGTSVTAVSFSPHSLSFTTSAGTYAFTNVFDINSSVVTAYSATQDATTGLEAITFAGSTTFFQSVATGGRYLWSNGGNWGTSVVPVNADSVTVTANEAGGFDDFAALNLASLTISPGALVNVTGASLNVPTLAGNGFLIADAFDSGAPVTVTVGAITDPGGTYEANGAGARFIDQSATDSGTNAFMAMNGGFVELAATPASDSVLYYRGSTATIALQAPGATNAALLDHLAVGDVLELPGTSVSSVSFGGRSLTITTDAGSYAFTNVIYAAPGTIANTFITHDATTGLAAITFAGTITFQQNVAVTSGKLQGDYLWSNPANWSNNLIPTDGENLITGLTTGVDDLGALSLASLTMTLGAAVYVIGTSLNVATVAGSGALIADAFLTGAPVTVTVGAITGTGGIYDAVGAGADFLDQSTLDTGNNSYNAGNGGFFELAAAPASSSSLSYFGTPSTLALQNPGASNAVKLTGVSQDDVLELPGASVNKLSFGTGTLSVTTNTGTYAFTDVSFADSVNNYSAAPDATTGLEAITFAGPTTFQQNVAAAGGPLQGQYLWSNAANWTTGVVPVSGDSVTTGTTTGYDDLAGLSLASLTLAANASVFVAAASLNVTTVAGSGGSFLDAYSFGLFAPVTVTVGAITGSGATYRAEGPETVFVDQSPVDTGNVYFAITGGVFELAAAPASTSQLAYSGMPSTFELQNPAASNNVPLTGVAQDDVLELPGASVSSVSFGAASLTVVTNLGAYAFTNVSYSGTVNNFTASHDAATNLEAITFAACYCRGTMILTDGGELAVEGLHIGDMVPALRSGTLSRIIWIGRSDLDCTKLADPAQGWPVRARAGAFADNAPHRDLWLSPQHAVLVDRVLIPVRHLINGHSIEQFRRDQVSYFHIELEQHDVLMAEGLPCESYLDTGNRAAFDNGQMPDGSDAALAANWDEHGCAPLVMDGELLEALWARLDRRGRAQDAQKRNSLSERYASRPGAGPVKAAFHGPSFWSASSQSSRFSTPRYIANGRRSSTK